MSRLLVRNKVVTLLLVIVMGFLLFKNVSQDGGVGFPPSAPLTVVIKPPEKIVLPPLPRQKASANASVTEKQNAPRPLWAIVDNAKLSLPLSSRVTEKAVIRMDQNFLGSLPVGAEMQFSMPDGQRLVAVVDQWIINPDGDKTLRAHIETNFGDYPFTYTMGKNAADETYGFGFVGLPEGRFTMEVSGEYGVIYRNPEPPKPADPSRRDYVLPAESSAPKTSTIKP